MEPQLALQFARASFGGDLREELALLQTPTVVLRCADDNMVPEVVGDFMREAIADCVLVDLDATGHCPQLSAPGEITRVVRGLLDKGWIETQPAELSSDL